MKYNRIQILGHPRSGTHYCAALVDLNFFDSSNYVRHYCKRAHRLGHEAQEMISKNSDTLFIYVVRDFDEVAKSIFNMRDRFGLVVDNYKTFLNSRYCDIWSKKIQFKIVINLLHTKKIKRNVYPYFRKVKETPKLFWDYHIQTWQKVEGDNTFCFYYNAVKKDLQSELLKLAEKLEVPKKNFLNINTRVGWIPEEK